MIFLYTPDLLLFTPDLLFRLLEYSITVPGGKFGRSCVCGLGEIGRIVDKILGTHLDEIIDPG